MADAPVLGIPFPEALLMATGLLGSPSPVAARACRKYRKEIEAGLDEALDRQDPAHLRVIKTMDSFWSTLQGKVYDDDADHRFVELRESDADADSYIALRTGARAAVEARVPTTVITTALGPRVMPPNLLSRNNFNVLCDTVSDHMRLVNDFAAAALTRAQVELYGEVFPGAYAWLLDTLVVLTGKRTAKDIDWLPPLWLQDMIKVLRGETLATLVATSAPRPAPPKTSGKFEVDVEGLKSPADTTLK